MAVYGNGFKHNSSEQDLISRTAVRHVRSQGKQYILLNQMEQINDQCNLRLCHTQLPLTNDQRRLKTTVEKVDNHLRCRSVVNKDILQIRSLTANSSEVLYISLRNATEVPEVSSCV